MVHYDTRDVPPAQRVDYWNGLCGRLFSPIAIDPLEPASFAGALDIQHDGIFQVSRFNTAPVHMSRNRGHTRDATTTGLTAFLRLQGQAHFTVRGERMLMTPGNFILMDAHTAFDFVAEQPTAALAIGIPDNFVSVHLPNIDRVVGRIFDATHPIHAIVAATMRQIGQISDDGGVPSPKLLRGMLELLSASIDEDEQQSVECGSAHAQRWMRRAMAFVAAHLRDPTLGAGRVAEALRISPRYLRMIFADHGENITTCIRRLRLEESAKCLLNPGWREIPLGEVAIHWGFEDAAYFSRCFKERYGTPPSQYRLRVAH